MPARPPTNGFESCSAFSMSERGAWSAVVRRAAMAITALTLLAPPSTAADPAPSSGLPGGNSRKEVVAAIAKRGAGIKCARFVWDQNVTFEAGTSRGLGGPPRALARQRYEQHGLTLQFDDQKLLHRFKVPCAGAAKPICATTTYVLDGTLHATYDSPIPGNQNGTGVLNSRQDYADYTNLYVWPFLFAIRGLPSQGLDAEMTYSVVEEKFASALQQDLRKDRKEPVGNICVLLSKSKTGSARRFAFETERGFRLVRFEEVRGPEDVRDLARDCRAELNVLSYTSDPASSVDVP